MSELLSVNKINFLRAQNEALKTQNKEMWQNNIALAKERNKYADVLREVYQACDTTGKGLNVFIQDLISEVLND